MKFSINLEIPSWIWFVIYSSIVLLSCITLVVLDTRGEIPWSTFTLVEEILTIFAFIIVFGGGTISVLWLFFEVTY